MTFEEVMEAKRRTRDAAIERLRSEAKARGQMADRAFWSMVYDFEMAPMTTNRRQLAEIRVDVQPASEFADDELSIKLREVIDALAQLNIFLLHTNHLSDRQLYERLEKDILDEEVRDLPADGAAREFVDLCIAETDEEWEVYQQVYDSVSTRPPPFDRDRTLPKPEGFGVK